MGYLSGPLEITIKHDGLSGSSGPYPFDRSGPPEIWGEGVEHETIEGLGEEGPTLAQRLNLKQFFTSKNLPKTIAIGAGIAGVIFLVTRKKRR